MTLSGFFTSFLTYLTMIPAAGLCFAPVHNYFRFKRSHTSFAAAGIIALLAVICSVLDNTFSLDLSTLFPPAAVLLFFCIPQSPHPACIPIFGYVRDGRGFLLVFDQLFHHF